MRAKDTATEITIEAVVTRADGMVENLGTVAYWNKSPIKRWSWNVKHFLSSGRTGYIS